jgi:dolichol-phosphate mannosyltransferase
VAIASRSVTVILPTLDEAENIDAVLAAVLKECDEASLDVEVFVVDDGSADGTRECVRLWESKDQRVHLLAREGERGLAGAVLAGARFASGDVVVVMDADLSHPAEVVPALARPLLEGTCDMVIGSRYVPGGATPGWPWSRRLLSRSVAVLAGLLVDVRDPCSGFFAVPRQTLLDAGKAPGGFKIGLDLLARARPGQRVKEIPITFRPRAMGYSKLSPRVAMSFLAQFASLAGGAVSVQFVVARILGLLLDIAVFHSLLGVKVALSTAHLTSFAVATIAATVLGPFLTFSRGNGERHPAALGQYVSFAAVALLAVFLRGGVLAFAHRSLGVPPELAIVPAAIGSGIVTYLGSVFFAFRASGQPTDARIVRRLAAAGVFAYLLVLRCVYAGEVELLPQEAYYWNYSQHLDLGYLDHPPMVAWLIWLGTHLFGQTELGVRALALVASPIAVYFSGRLAEHLFGRLHAYLVVLLFAVLPFTFGTAFFMTPDTPLVSCWAGALYFLERALVAGHRRAWLGAGLCVGLGLLSKYTIALLVLAALAYMLLDRASRRWFRSPWPYAAILLALLLMSPVLFWNAQHDWASFNFQGPQRWNHAPRFELARLVWNVLMLITPLGIVGAAWGFVRASRRQRFGLVFTLVPLSIFVLSSLWNETKLNWTGPVWLAALPFMAASLIPPSAESADRVAIGWTRPWKVTVLALLLFYGALLHYDVWGLPGVPEPISHLGKSWRDLSGQVQEMEAEVHRRTGQEPLVVGMDKYNLASELAFYAPAGDGARRTASHHLFGRQGLMYGFWFPPQQQVGKSLILVAKDQETLEEPGLRLALERLEPVRELRVGTTDTTTQYFVRVGHGYQGVAPP